MSPPIITELTADQKAQIPTYRDKWKQIALSTEPINQEEAKKAIKRAYSLISTENFASTCCSNPDTDPDLNTLVVEVWNYLRSDLISQVTSQLGSGLLRNDGGKATECQKFMHRNRARTKPHRHSWSCPFG